MTDHEKLLVAVLSETADGERDGRGLTAPALMALLCRLGEHQPRPVTT